MNLGMVSVTSELNLSYLTSDSISLVLGNPFLMFLCLTLLIQHRDYIMKTGMDYNEMAMHFDKMVRKHNVTRVLSQARRLYQDYLRSHNERLKHTIANNTINSTKI